MTGASSSHRPTWCNDTLSSGSVYYDDSTYSKGESRSNRSNASTSDGNFISGAVVGAAAIGAAAAVAAAAASSSNTRDRSSSIGGTATETLQNVGGSKQSRPSAESSASGTSSLASSDVYTNRSEGVKNGEVRAVDLSSSTSSDYEAKIAAMIRSQMQREGIEPLTETSSPPPAPLEDIMNLAAVKLAAGSSYETSNKDESASKDACQPGSEKQDLIAGAANPVIVGHLVETVRSSDGIPVVRGMDVLMPARGMNGGQSTVSKFTVSENERSVRSGAASTRKLSSSSAENERPSSFNESVLNSQLDSDSEKVGALVAHEDQSSQPTMQSDRGFGKDDSSNKDDEANALKTTAAVGVAAAVITAASVAAAAAAKPTTTATAKPNVTADGSPAVSVATSASAKSNPVDGSCTDNASAVSTNNGSDAVQDASASVSTGHIERNSSHKSVSTEKSSSDDVTKNARTGVATGAAVVLGVGAATMTKSLMNAEKDCDNADVGGALAEHDPIDVTDHGSHGGVSPGNSPIEQQPPAESASRSRNVEEIIVLDDEDDHCYGDNEGKDDHQQNLPSQSHSDGVIVISDSMEEKHSYEDPCGDDALPSRDSAQSTGTDKSTSNPAGAAPVIDLVNYDSTSFEVYDGESGDVIVCHEMDPYEVVDNPAQSATAAATSSQAKQGPVVSEESKGQQKAGITSSQLLAPAVASLATIGVLSTMGRARDNAQTKEADASTKKSAQTSIISETESASASAVPTPQEEISARTRSSSAQDDPSQVVKSSSTRDGSEEMDPSAAKEQSIQSMQTGQEAKRNECEDHGKEDATINEEASNGDAPKRQEVQSAPSSKPEELPPTRAMEREIISESEQQGAATDENKTGSADTVAKTIVAAAVVGIAGIAGAAAMSSKRASNGDEDEEDEDEDEASDKAEEAVGETQQKTDATTSTPEAHTAVRSEQMEADEHLRAMSNPTSKSSSTIHAPSSSDRMEVDTIVDDEIVDDHVPVVNSFGVMEPSHSMKSDGAKNSASSPRSTNTRTIAAVTAIAAAAAAAVAASGPAHEGNVDASEHEEDEPTASKSHTASASSGDSSDVQTFDSPNALDSEQDGIEISLSQDLVRRQDYWPVNATGLAMQQRSEAIDPPQDVSNVGVSYSSSSPSVPPSDPSGSSQLSQLLQSSASSQPSQSVGISAASATSKPSAGADPPSAASRADVGRAATAVAAAGLVVSAAAAVVAATASKRGLTSSSSDSFNTAVGSHQQQQQQTQQQRQLRSISRDPLPSSSLEGEGAAPPASSSRRASAEVNDARSIDRVSKKASAESQSIHDTTKSNAAVASNEAHDISRGTGRSKNEGAADDDQSVASKQSYASRASAGGKSVSSRATTRSARSRSSRMSKPTPEDMRSTHSRARKPKPEASVVSNTRGIDTIKENMVIQVAAATVGVAAATAVIAASGRRDDASAQTESRSKSRSLSQAQSGHLAATGIPVLDTVHVGSSDIDQTIELILSDEQTAKDSKGSNGDGLTTMLTSASTGENGSKSASASRSQQVGSAIGQRHIPGMGFAAGSLVSGSRSYTSAIQVNKTNSSMSRQHSQAQRDRVGMMSRTWSLSNMTGTKSNLKSSVSGKDSNTTEGNCQDGNEHGDKNENTSTSRLGRGLALVTVAAAVPMMAHNHQQSQHDRSHNQRTVASNPGTSHNMHSAGTERAQTDANANAAHTTRAAADISGGSTATRPLGTQTFSNDADPQGTNGISNDGVDDSGTNPYSPTRAMLRSMNSDDFIPSNGMAGHMLDDDDAYWDTLSTIASTKDKSMTSGLRNGRRHRSTPAPAPIPSEITTKDAQPGSTSAGVAAVAVAAAAATAAVTAAVSSSATSASSEGESGTAATIPVQTKSHDASLRTKSTDRANSDKMRGVSHTDDINQSSALEQSRDTQLQSTEREPSVSVSAAATTTTLGLVTGGAAIAAAMALRSSSSGGDNQSNKGDDLAKEITKTWSSSLDPSRSKSKSLHPSISYATAETDAKSGWKSSAIHASTSSHSQASISNHIKAQSSAASASQYSTNAYPALVTGAKSMPIAGVDSRSTEGQQHGETSSWPRSGTTNIHADSLRADTGSRPTVGNGVRRRFGRGDEDRTAVELQTSETFVSAASSVSGEAVGASSGMVLGASAAAAVTAGSIAAARPKFRQMKVIPLPMAVPVIGSSPSTSDASNAASEDNVLHAPPLKSDDSSDANKGVLQERVGQVDNDDDDDDARPDNVKAVELTMAKIDSLIDTIGTNVIDDVSDVDDGRSTSSLSYSLSKYAASVMTAPSSSDAGGSEGALSKRSNSAHAMRILNSCLSRDPSGAVSSEASSSGEERSKTELRKSASAHSQSSLVHNMSGSAGSALDGSRATDGSSTIMPTVSQLNMGHGSRSIGSSQKSIMSSSTQAPSATSAVDRAVHETPSATNDAADGMDLQHHQEQQQQQQLLQGPVPSSALAGVNLDNQYLVDESVQGSDSFGTEDNSALLLTVTRSDMEENSSSAKAASEGGSADGKARSSDHEEATRTMDQQPFHADEDQAPQQPGQAIDGAERTPFNPLVVGAVATAAASAAGAAAMILSRPRDASEDGGDENTSGEIRQREVMWGYEEVFDAESRRSQTSSTRSRASLPASASSTASQAGMDYPPMYAHSHVHRDHLNQHQQQDYGVYQNRGHFAFHQPAERSLIDPPEETNEVIDLSHASWDGAVMVEDVMEFGSTMAAAGMSSEDQVSSSASSSSRSDVDTLAAMIRKRQLATSSQAGASANENENENDPPGESAEGRREASLYEVLLGTLGVAGSAAFIAGRSPQGPPSEPAKQDAPADCDQIELQAARTNSAEEQPSGASQSSSDASSANWQRELGSNLASSTRHGPQDEEPRQQQQHQPQHQSQQQPHFKVMRDPSINNLIHKMDRMNESSQRHNANEPRSSDSNAVVGPSHLRGTQQESQLRTVPNTNRAVVHDDNSSIMNETTANRDLLATMALTEQELDDLSPEEEERLISRTLELSKALLASMNTNPTFDSASDEDMVRSLASRAAQQEGDASASFRQSVDPESAAASRYGDDESTARSLATVTRSRASRAPRPEHFTGAALVEQERSVANSPNDEGTISTAPTPQLSNANNETIVPLSVSFHQRQMLAAKSKGLKLEASASVADSSSMPGDEDENEDEHEDDSNASSSQHPQMVPAAQRPGSQSRSSSHTHVSDLSPETPIELDRLLAQFQLLTRQLVDAPEVPREDYDNTSGSVASRQDANERSKRTGDKPIAGIAPRIGRAAETQSMMDAVSTYQRLEQLESSARPVQFGSSAAHHQTANRNPSVTSEQQQAMEHTGVAPPLQQIPTQQLQQQPQERFATRLQRPSIREAGGRIGHAAQPTKNTTMVGPPGDNDMDSSAGRVQRLRQQRQNALDRLRASKTTSGRDLSTNASGDAVPLSGSDHSLRQVRSEVGSAAAPSPRAPRQRTPRAFQDRDLPHSFSESQMYSQAYTRGTRQHERQHQQYQQYPRQQQQQQQQPFPALQNARRAPQPIQRVQPRQRDRFSQYQITNTLSSDTNLAAGSSAANPVDLDHFSDQFDSDTNTDASESVGMTTQQANMDTMDMHVRMSESSDSETTTPSTKARDLQKQIQDVLQASKELKSTQEKLGSELTSFKSRYHQRSSHLEGKAMRMVGEVQSLRGGSNSQSSGFMASSSSQSHQAP